MEGWNWIERKTLLLCIPWIEIDLRGQMSSSYKLSHHKLQKVLPDFKGLRIIFKRQHLITTGGLPLAAGQTNLYHAHNKYWRYALSFYKSEKTTSISSPSSIWPNKFKWGSGDQFFLRCNNVNGCSHLYVEGRRRISHPALSVLIKEFPFWSDVRQSQGWIMSGWRYCRAVSNEGVILKGAARIIWFLPCCSTITV